MMKTLVPALLAVWGLSILPASADTISTDTRAFSNAPASASQWQINRIRTADRDDGTYDYSDDDPYYDDGYDDGSPDYSYDNYSGGGYYPRGYRGRHWKWGSGNGHRPYSENILPTPAEQGGMRGR